MAAKVAVLVPALIVAGMVATSAHAARDAGIATTRGDGRQASSFPGRPGARIDASGSLQAKGHADADAADGTAEDTAPKPSQPGDR